MIDLAADKDIIVKSGHGSHIMVKIGQGKVNVIRWLEGQNTRRFTMMSITRIRRSLHR